MLQTLSGSVLCVINVPISLLCGEDPKKKSHMVREGEVHPASDVSVGVCLGGGGGVCISGFVWC